LSNERQGQVGNVERREHFADRRDGPARAHVGSARAPRAGFSASRAPQSGIDALMEWQRRLACGALK
jgi:hypothetical protein